jgi:phage terminase large subunit-like protein
MGVTLMPWQVLAISGQLEHDTAGDLVFREALVSTARQNGKTAGFSAMVGWWLTEMAQIRGAPQSVVTTAHKLDRAFATFQQLAPVLEKLGGKVFWSYGRNSVTMPDGSVWRVLAATPQNAHGGTNDLIVADEIWSISPEVIFDAYRPSMIARRSPLLSMWSTAGDESSKAMLQLREQAMHAIDNGRHTALYFAEWSPPPTVRPGSVEALKWANPALGTTITLEALQAAAETPDRQAFMRAHCNTWVSAAGAWIPQGLWQQLEVDTPMPSGGVLAVDSSLDDLRYVGVRAVQNGDRIQVRSEFVVESANAMWDAIDQVLTDPGVRLAITPGLADIAPPRLERRLTVVGMSELYKYTGIVKSLMAEHRVSHTNQMALSEHVCRAVAARAQNSITLSSQKSPGPIELARCMVWAVGMAAKPTSETRKPAFGVSRT